VTTSDKFELLKDLTRLLKKHGPNAFSDLSEFLKSPGGIDELITLLEASSTAGRKARVTKASGTRKRAQEKLNEILFEIESSEPHKAEVLSVFVREFHAKRVLPALRDVRDFASDNGLGWVAATSREKALLPLVRDLMTRPTGELSTILKTVTVREHSGDRSLEGWADVILDKDRRNR